MLFYVHVVPDDGTLGSEADTGQFWVLFGGFAPLSKKLAVVDDAPDLVKPKLLWCVKSFPSVTNSSMLCYILTLGFAYLLPYACNAMSNFLM